MDRKKNIILIGMPGSGKSTVGVLVAKAIGMNFMDVDLLIQNREDMLLQEIVDERGTERFLDAEEEAVCSIRCQGTVIAPGGSAVLRDKAAEHLKSLGIMIYLKLPMEALTARLNNMATRGIAMEPGQTLEDLFNYRSPIYERWADITVDVDEQQRLEQTVAAVLDKLDVADNIRNKWPER